MLHIHTSLRGSVEVYVEYGLTCPYYVFSGFIGMYTSRGMVGIAHHTLIHIEYKICMSVRTTHMKPSPSSSFFFFFSLLSSSSSLLCSASSVVLGRTLTVDPLRLWFSVGELVHYV